MRALFEVSIVAFGFMIGLIAGSLIQLQALR